MTYAIEIERMQRFEFVLDADSEDQAREMARTIRFAACHGRTKRSSPALPTPRRITPRPRAWLIGH